MSEQGRPRRVLIISRYFPPLYDVGGKRAYRFALHLPDHGWQPIILTGAARLRAAVVALSAQPRGRRNHPLPGSDGRPRRGAPLAAVPGDDAPPS